MSILWTWKFFERRKTHARNIPFNLASYHNLAIRGTARECYLRGRNGPWKDIHLTTGVEIKADEARFEPRLRYQFFTHRRARNKWYLRRIQPINYLSKNEEVRGERETRDTCGKRLPSKRCLQMSPHRNDVDRDTFLMGQRGLLRKHSRRMCIIRTCEATVEQCWVLFPTFPPGLAEVLRSPAKPTSYQLWRLQENYDHARMVPLCARLLVHFLCSLIISIPAGWKVQNGLINCVCVLPCEMDKEIARSLLFLLIINNYRDIFILTWLNNWKILGTKFEV